MAYLFKRGSRYHLKYYIAGKQKEVALRTESLQLAREKMRRFESSLAQGNENALPTHTPIATVLKAYVAHLRANKTPKSIQNDIYYLREMFGLVCDELVTTRRLPGAKARRLSTQPDARGRTRVPPIEAQAFEAITPQQVAGFIESKIKRQGIAPKTSNHYRSILRRVFNWGMKQHGLRIPNNTNPAAQIDAYREKDRPIHYLTHPQIKEQLDALKHKPQLQTMTAMLIYAGVRRAELLWLTVDDVCLPSEASGKPGMILIRPKVYDGFEWTPKTGRSRVVPISTTLRLHLTQYHPPATAAGNPKAPGNGWYFPSPKGRRWEEDNFSADLRETNAKYGLTWSCLDFRHTFGSHLAQKDVSLYKISQLMGNSPEICRKHYAALVPEHMVNEVEF